MNKIFSDLATEENVEVAPFKDQDSHLFRKNGITKRVLDIELAVWSEEEFQVFLQSFNIDPGRTRLVNNGRRRVARYKFVDHYTEVKNESHPLV